MIELAGQNEILREDAEPNRRIELVKFILPQIHSAFRSLAISNSRLCQKILAELMTRQNDFSGRRHTNARKIFAASQIQFWLSAIRPMHAAEELAEMIDGQNEYPPGRKTHGARKIINCTTNCILP